MVDQLHKLTKDNCIGMLKSLSDAEKIEILNRLSKLAKTKAKAEGSVTGAHHYYRAWVQVTPNLTQYRSQQVFHFTILKWVHDLNLNAWRRMHDYKH